MLELECEFFLQIIRTDRGGVLFFQPPIGSQTKPLQQLLSGFCVHVCSANTIKVERYVLHSRRSTIAVKTGWFFSEELKFEKVESEINFDFLLFWERKTRLIWNIYEESGWVIETVGEIILNWSSAEHCQLREKLKMLKSWFWVCVWCCTCCWWWCQWKWWWWQWLQRWDCGEDWGRQWYWQWR